MSTFLFRQLTGKHALYWKGPSAYRHNYRQSRKQTKGDIFKLIWQTAKVKWRHLLDMSETSGKDYDNKLSSTVIAQSVRHILHVV